ncbi:FAD-binding oxidoreductase [Actinoallomurus sp. CA-142502]|uniref:FAD-binding oxidoreductase n=1 Tax=Actinoallomurus sp. CA-142502 TaxID=3239885 RepID=UPI003D900D6E
MVRCRTATDVAEAVSFARRFSIATAVRSGGHDFAGRSSTSGLLIDLGLMNTVTMSGNSVVVGAGTKLGDLYRSLRMRGRTVPGGCGPSVGVAGLTLGGGLGILGRAHGLTCDRLVRAQVVLANGHTVECDDQHDGELFWALRGAGAGQFGVVTTLVFDTVSAPRCSTFELTWDYRHAARLVEAWQAWAPDAPDPLAVSLLLNAPADPRRPPRVTVLGAAAALAPEPTDEFLDAFIVRTGAAPQTRWCRDMSWPDTKRRLAERAPGDDDGHLFSKSEFFQTALPAEAIEELVDGLVATRHPGEARELDFSPWGGAYKRVPADATAFVHRDERFLLKHAAVVNPSACGPRRPVAGDWLTQSWQTVRPWGTGRVYPNFPDPDLDDPGRAYFGANLERVVQAKATYDPEGVFPWLPAQIKRRPTAASPS